MRMEHFGDAHDIVKQQLLGWLGASSHPWAVQPMFSESVSSESVRAYKRFLARSIRILNAGDFSRCSDRVDFLSRPDWKGSGFFDPDTGVPINQRARGPRESPEKYLFLEELVLLVKERPGKLTMVFDQSVPRGRERQAEEEKLSVLHDAGILGMAYIAQAPFLVLSCVATPLLVAKGALLSNSRLPESRILMSL